MKLHGETFQEARGHIAEIDKHSLATHGKKASQVSGAGIISTSSILHRGHNREALFLKGEQNAQITCYIMNLSKSGMVLVRLILSSF